MKKYVIGVDFGSDSCRGVIIDTENGKELVNEIFYYPRWKEGLYCDPSKFQYRQHPLDYVEGIKHVISTIVKKVDKSVSENIVAISMDTTGSTPCAIDKDGTPLALLPEFSENPNAMFILWKDHTSVEEAKLITTTAKTWGGIDYSQYIGGIYSSEWFYAKILKTLRIDEEVRNAAVSWVEHCDWMPAYLTGVKNHKDIVRGRCAAGHKSLWRSEYGGLPSNDFFKTVDPLLDGLRDNLFEDSYTSEHSVGTITKELAEEFGIPTTTKVGVGAFDCHMGAVGGNIKEKTIVKVIGTSTCDIMIANKSLMENICVDGICGQVDGSVYEGMIGLEAGQSAFGDLYAFYRKIIAWPLKLIPQNNLSDSQYKDMIASIESNILVELEKEAALLPTNLDSVLSLDWINGRRTPYANQKLKGAITGITLDTDAPKIYRSLIEATAFGSKAIVEKFRESGVTVESAIAIGGIPKKSQLNMQILANVLDMPVKVCESDQAVALGASIFASVVGGVYKNIEEAQEKMASSVAKTYLPEKNQVEIYKEMYNKYINLGNEFEKMINI